MNCKSITTSRTVTFFPWLPFLMLPAMESRSKSFFRCVSSIHLPKFLGTIKLYSQWIAWGWDIHAREYLQRVKVVNFCLPSLILVLWQDLLVSRAVLYLLGFCALLIFYRQYIPFNMRLHFTVRRVSNFAAIPESFR